MTQQNTLNLFDFEQLKNMQPSIKLAVHGYIREFQQLLPSNNAYYNIPQLIKFIIIFYYNDQHSLNPDINMFIGSWNVNGQMPPDDRSCIESWLFNDDTFKQKAKIYVCGFQEIVPLNTFEYAKNNFGKFIKNNIGGNWGQKADNEICQKRANAWKDEISRILGPDEFEVISSNTLFGILLVIYVHKSLVNDIDKEQLFISTASVGKVLCLKNRPNKGAVGIRLKLRNINICFVCTHLEAGDEEKDKKKRNDDVDKIMKNLKFKTEHDDQLCTLEDLKCKNNDTIFWFGDLNYRLDAAKEERYTVRDLIEEKNWSHLMLLDQLYKEMHVGTVFKNFVESDITFQPSYKYKIATSEYDDKKRLPAYTDRILYYIGSIDVECVKYDILMEAQISDHKPVFAHITLKPIQIQTRQRR